MRVHPVDGAVVERHPGYDLVTAFESVHDMGDPVEQMFHGFSTLVCLPDGLFHEGSVGTGTVMRVDTPRRYAEEGGFDRVEVLPIEHETFRFCQLHP